MRIPYEHVRQYKETAGLKTCAWVTSCENSEGAEIKDRHDIQNLEEAQGRNKVTSGTPPSFDARGIFLHVIQCAA